MNPPTQNDRKDFDSLHVGGENHCINWLANTLVNCGSISETLSKIRKIVDSCPNNQTYQEHLEVFSFMFERIDQSLIDDLLKKLIKIKAKIDKCSENKVVAEKKLDSLNQDWDLVAEQARKNLNELQGLVESWHPLNRRSSVFKYKNNCWMMHDPATYATNRTEIQNGLDKLVSAIDTQMMQEKLEIKVITMLRNLFENISQLDQLQQNFANSKTKESSCAQELAAEIRKNEEQNAKLISELWKIPLSGRFALFYLLRQDQNVSDESTEKLAVS